MAEYVQKGDAITVTVTDAVNVGDLYIKGDLIGIVSNSAVAGGEAVVQTSGVFRFVTDASLAVGAKAYATPTGTISATASGNTLVGVVVGVGAGYVDIKL